MLFARTSIAIAAAAAIAGCSANEEINGIPTDPITSLRTIGDSATSAVYRIDATALAIRQLRRGIAVDKQQTEVSEALVASLHNALGAVYDSKSPQRDTVVNVYKIHVFPVSRELNVAPQAGNDIARAWASGQTKTGVVAIDTLVTKYGLKVTWQNFSSPFAVLTPSRTINVLPLAAAFARVPGIRFAEPNGYAGDGNDITAYPMTNGWRLDYSFGSGDCPAGCINRRYWTFEVTTDGTVKFTGARNDVGHPPRE